MYKIESCLGYKVTTNQPNIVSQINTFIETRIFSKRIFSPILTIPDSSSDKLVCPLFYILLCFSECSFDFHPNENFIVYLNLIEENILYIKDINEEIEVYEEYLFKYFKAYSVKDYKTIWEIITLHSISCKDDYLGLTIFKIDVLSQAGMNKHNECIRLFNLYFQNNHLLQEILDKKHTSSQVTKKNKELFLIFALSFLAEEANEYNLSLEVSYIGLKEMFSPYLLHSVMHVFQGKGEFIQSIDVFNNFVKGNDLYINGGDFIYQHIYWHVAVGFLVEYEKRNINKKWDAFDYKSIDLSENITNTNNADNYLNISIKIFKDIILKVSYLDTECYVNILGYLIWIYTLSNTRININYLRENEILSENEVERLLFILSNETFYMKHTLFDYFSFWFLSQTNEYDIIIKIKSQITKNLLFIDKSLYIIDEIKNFYNKYYSKYIDGFILFGSKDINKVKNGVENIRLLENFHLSNSGSMEQMIILSFIGNIKL